MSVGGTHGGVWLRALRLRAGMQIDDVASAASTSPEYLAAVEAGTLTAAPPFIHHVAGVIADGLGGGPGVRGIGDDEAHPSAPGDSQAPPA